jgi:hypothetical protein
MPVSWTSYDSFSWPTAKQSPMDAGERQAVGVLAANALGLSDEDRDRAWGEAGPPGRYAATVIRLRPGIPHKYQASTASLRANDVAVKIFKCNDDAQRAVRRLIPFHLSELARLPGIPNAHVQRSLDAGTLVDPSGAERGYVVQEWAPGLTLEQWAHAGAARKLARPQLRAIISQLFLDIIVPLWHSGTIWWDIRDANFVFCDQRGFLTMIDADSLAAYAKEILDVPTTWDAREKGRKTALARLRQMTNRLILAHGSAAKGGTEIEVRTAWSTILEPALQSLGRQLGQDEVCRSHVQGFIKHLEQTGLLGVDEGAPHHDTFNGDRYP